MKTILITGSTKGIGNVFAKYLSKTYNIIIHGSSKESIDECRIEMDNINNINYISHNLSNNPQELIDKSLQIFGNIDILINNCGICKLDNETNHNENNLFINSLTPYILSKYSINKGVKNIINISSGGAVTYKENMNDYCLSKNILESITKYLAYEYYDKCIITCLRIDNIFKTDMSKNIYTPEEYKNFLEPYNLLPLLLSLLKGDKEYSGKIYSYNRSRTNLFMELKFNNNYIIDHNLKFINNDDYKEKYVINGENKFTKNNNQYPSDKSIIELEEIISEINNIPKENILLNSGGITQAFDLLCQHFITPGDEVICHTLTYQPSSISVINKYGNLKLIQPILNDSSLNYKLESILDYITSATKMIYLVHPTYLFGDIFDEKSFTDILNKIPNNIAIILDECYIDYYEKNILNSMNFINTHFVFGLRTFSKLYGLPNTRLSYILCNKKYRNILKNSFTFKNIPDTSIKEVKKSLLDKDYEKIKCEFIKEKNYLETELKKLNIKFCGENMFLIVFVKNKKEILEELTNNNIILIDTPITNETIVYTICKRIINEKFINIIKKYN